MDRVVVVGAGLAGLQSVIALRGHGYVGDLILLGAEASAPYDRPPLSKAVLLGDAEDTTLPFDPTGLKVDVRLGESAGALRPGVVETEAGDLAYDGLVLASGAEPVRLPGQGALYLRTREEALALRWRLVPGAVVVVVGAGWIGAEVATAAGKRGCQVTVVEQAATPVAHALPATVGRYLSPWYAEAGVELLCGQRVASVRQDGVDLADGRVLGADVVVVGVGVRPATRWLDGSGIELDRGILVGPDLRTSWESVVAVGNAVARWSPRYGERIRGEHWDDALRSPATATGSLLGRVESYDPVPYVWSEQFGRFVQYAGHPGPADQLVWRGDPTTDPTWAAIWLSPDGRMTAMLAVDRPRDLVQGRRLAEAGTQFDAELLIDPAVTVRAAVAGLAG